MLPLDQDLQAQFSEVDLLTGCLNLVSFTRGIENNFGNDTPSPLTLIEIDVHQLRRVNQERGFDFGDQLLRWLGIALRDEMGNTIYRISGDAFVVVLPGGSIEEHNAKARDLFERLNLQAKQLNLETPVVRMAAIHFADGKPLNTALVWKNLNEVMELVNGDRPFQVITSKPLQDADQETVRAIELMAERVVSLGYMLNVTFRMAYTDPVGNLPNLIATQRKLDLTLAEANSAHTQFSLFLIDGDDLKRYNKISYAVGDKLIGLLSAVLKAAVRPGDFVGRWRFGDEFIIILPNTTVDQAVGIGDKIRIAVWEASQDWLFTTSISLGVVHYPRHGSTLSELMEKAEKALSQAKAAGKNRIVLAS